VELTLVFLQCLLLTWGYILGGLLGIHRSDFSRVLLQHLPSTYRTHCFKRLLSYRQQSSYPGPIELVFADGTTANCDVLIGADGIKSSVRRSLLREQGYRARADGRQRDYDHLLDSVDPVWSGTLAYTAVISAERLKARAPHHRAFDQPTQVRW
jgi:salicylate hydroxylase